MWPVASTTEKRLLRSHITMLMISTSKLQLDIKSLKVKEFKVEGSKSMKIIEDADQESLSFPRTFDNLQESVARLVKICKKFIFKTAKKLQDL